MSTKGLMADKRVASVELDDKGKAKRLTLAPGWTFEGSAGPFDLTNVEHGHKIVKAAVGDETVAKAVPAPRKAPSPTPGEAPQALEPGGGRKPLPRFDATLKPRGDVILVYRLQLMPKGDTREQTVQGKEVCGWLKLPAAEKLSKAELEKRTWSMLRGHVKGATEETHEAKSFRWTNKHQSEARGKQEMGSPWHGENHGN